MQLNLELWQKWIKVFCARICRIFCIFLCIFHIYFLGRRALCNNNSDSLLLLFISYEEFAAPSEKQPKQKTTMRGSKVQIIKRNFWDLSSTMRLKKDKQKKNTYASLGPGQG